MDFQTKARPGAIAALSGSCPQAPVFLRAESVPQQGIVWCDARLGAAPGVRHRAAPRLPWGSPAPKRATISVRITVPPLGPLTAYLSQRRHKLQVTLTTYGLLKPQLGGPAEQTLPARDRGLLERHVLRTAPGTVTALRPELRTRLTVSCTELGSLPALPTGSGRSSVGRR